MGFQVPDRHLSTEARVTEVSAAVPVTGVLHSEVSLVSALASQVSPDHHCTY